MNSKENIGKMLTGITSIVIIVAIFAVATFSSVMYYQMLRDERIGNVESQLSELEPRFDGWFEKQFNGINRDLAYLRQNQQIDKNAAQNYFYEVMKISGEEYSMVYAGWPDGTATFGQPVNLPTDWRSYDRPWYTMAAEKPGTIIATKPYPDANDNVKNSLCISFASTISPTDASLGVVAADINIDELTNHLSNAENIEGTYSFITDGSGNILYHHNPKLMPDANGNFVNIQVVSDGYYADYWKTISSGLDRYTTKMTNYDGDVCYFVHNRLQNVDWYLISVISSEQDLSAFYRFLGIITAIAVIAIIISILLVRRLTVKVVTRPIHQFTETAGLIAQGAVDLEIDPQKYTGEMRSLADSFAHILENSKTQTDVVDAVAAGDYSLHVTPRSDRDVMNKALNHMLNSTNETLHQINQSAAMVASGSMEISNGAQDLASGANEQSNAVDELSAAINGIALKTKENADMAGQAAQLADSIAANAEKGSRQMDEMMNAVQEIHQANNSIKNVIKVIDDIAFQTNILSLNAAVEAARAGEHGKGFAVVAEEVRRLAAKSAEAAKDTEELITNSIEKAQLGVHIATETAAYLTEIVSGIGESNQIVNTIAKSSEEQSVSISGINNGIEQVAVVVQRNTATAEESAATSEELRSQSALLEELISRFKLRR